jgi:hypothetical protein
MCIPLELQVPPLHWLYRLGKLTDQSPNTSLMKTLGLVLGTVRGDCPLIYQGKCFVTNMVNLCMSILPCF